MDRRRRWAVTAGLGMVISVAAAITVMWPEDEAQRSTPPTGTSVQGSTSTSASSSTTTSTMPSSTSTVALDAVPGVPGVSAGPGGGSSEITVDWSAVSAAKGYRVLRSESSDGAFAVVADLDVLTGDAWAAAGVVNIWSEQHAYVPASGPLEGPDRSSSFQYVEVAAGEQRCFRVIAYNDAGDGPPSVAVCAEPR